MPQTKSHRANEARIALMVFLIAYALFEVPSNYFLKKLRPSVRPILSSITHQANIPSDGSHSSCCPGARQPCASAASTTMPR